jgi:hypothetical protein
MVTLNIVRYIAPRCFPPFVGEYQFVRTAILYLHRSHFAQIRGEPNQETYAGSSVWAVYRSSARLIRALTSLYARHPDMTSKMWYFWTAYYSACVRVFTSSPRISTKSSIDCDRVSCPRQAMVPALPTCGICCSEGGGRIRAGCEGIRHSFDTGRLTLIINCSSYNTYP